MTKSVLLRKEDCYCKLIKFYENVARKVLVEITDETRFDCRKILVTRSVQETLWSYYRDEIGLTDEQIATMLLAFGPKANLEEHDVPEYRAEIEDGFISCEEG